MLDFTRSEQLTIRAWYGAIGISTLAKRIRKPEDAIHAEAMRLGLRKPSKAAAKQAEVNDAKERRTGHRNLAEMAESARSRSELRAQKMAENKARREKEKVSKREMMAVRHKALLSEFPYTNNRALAQKYGCSISAVQRIAAANGALKSPDHVARAKHESGKVMADKYNGRIKAMRQATDLLRAGDHVGALDVLEAAL